MFFAPYLGSCMAQMAGWMACAACQCAGREVLRHSARLAWSVLFFLAMVAAWVLRDFATPLLQHIPCRWCRSSLLSARMHTEHNPPGGG